MFASGVLWCPACQVTPHPCTTAPAVKELARRVQGASPLGEYATPLGIIRSLVSNEHLAAALVRLPSWMPNLATHTARALQLPGSCWLGPCFSPSPVPDELIPAQPPVVASCFSGVSAGTRRQVSSSMQTCQPAVASCCLLHTMLQPTCDCRTVRWVSGHDLCRCCCAGW
jgi:hypothetical protein